MTEDRSNVIVKKPQSGETTPEEVPGVEQDLERSNVIVKRPQGEETKPEEILGPEVDFNKE